MRKAPFSALNSNGRSTAIFFRGKHRRHCDWKTNCAWSQIDRSNGEFETSCALKTKFEIVLDNLFRFYFANHGMHRGAEHQRDDSRFSFRISYKRFPSNEIRITVFPFDLRCMGFRENRVWSTESLRPSLWKYPWAWTQFWMNSF